MDLELLEGDADDHAVVEEALALIDKLASTESPSSPSSSRSVESSKQRKKRRRNAAVDVARRQRKKQERVALRIEAQKLEDRLKLLRAMKSAKLMPGVQDISTLLESTDGQIEMRRERAIVQAEKLVAAMDLNMQLRGALKQQRTLVEAVRVALTHQQPTQPVVHSQRLYSDHVCRSPKDNAIMLMLRHSVKQIYDQIDDELALISTSTGLFSSNLAVKLDPVSGPYSEHTTTTMVPHGLDFVVKLIEEGLLQISPPCVDLSLHIKTSTDDICNGIEKEYTVELHTPDKNIPLRGHGVFRIHRENDRVAVVWSKQVAHTTGLCFQERAWLLVAPSPATSSTQTTVRSCYHLNVDKSSDIDSSSRDEVLLGFIQSKLVTRARDKLEMIQFKLLEKADEIAIHDT